MKFTVTVERVLRNISLVVVEASDDITAGDIAIEKALDGYVEFDDTTDFDFDVVDVQLVRELPD